MKKSLLLIITLFCLFSSLFSQINETSVWHYYQIELGEPNRTNLMDIEKDTIINGEVYYIVDGLCNCTTIPRQIIRSVSRKMYYYYNSQEHLLYDFNMKQGDTMSIYWPISDLENSDPHSTIDSIYYVVDSIEVLYFRNTRTEKYYITNFYNGSLNNYDYTFGNVIYKQIGGNCLFPSGGDFQCEVESVDLLCYERNGVNSHFNSSDCESNFQSEVEDYHPFVDPNKLWITYESGIPAKHAFSQDSFFYGNHYYHHLATSYEEHGLFDFSAGWPMREQDKEVYIYEDGEEYLVFNFNFETGDTLFALDRESNSLQEIRVFGIDFIRLKDGSRREIWLLGCDGQRHPAASWIDGIGDPVHFIQSYMACYTDIGREVTCYYENGVEKYSPNSPNSPCWRTGVFIDEEISKTSVFPNPVLDFLTIHDHVFEKYEIYDITGVKVLAGGFVERVDFRALPKGVFFVNLINSDRENIVTRVVKL